MGSAAARGQSEASSPLPNVGSPRYRDVQLVWRDTTTAFVYTRPGLFRAFTSVPATLARSAQLAVRPQQLPELAGVVAGTLVLYGADESILHETRRFARRVGLPPNHPSADLRIGPFKQGFPTTIGSGLYFLGDGLTSVALAAGFAVHGAIWNNVRSSRVASEVVEALIASGAVTQAGKHIAGRQTPSEATVPRGRWRPFPPLGDYNRNVPGYDAFPSGHLASTAATLTVLALNYPESRIVRPIGYSAMALLSFAMVNNGVHWASDYPVALGVGVAIGKVVADRGRATLRFPPRASELAIPPTATTRRIDMAPLIEPGTIGVRVRF